MNFDRDEAEMKTVFESFRIRKPPEPLMRNYEKEVWERIRRSERTPTIGWGFALSAAFLLALLFAFFFLLQPERAKEEARVPVSPAGAAPDLVLPSPLPVPAPLPKREESVSQTESARQEDQESLSHGEPAPEDEEAEWRDLEPIAGVKS